jgi:predicted HTH transcriptional regulator
MKTENHRIEFKRQLTDSLEKAAVAFLNTHEGGVIIIGMDDQGKAIGVDNADALQLKIKDRLKNNITPSTMGLFNVLCEQQQGKNLIKIILASGLEKPYYLHKHGMSPKGCFIHIGSASEPMTARMIEDLFARRIRNSIGNIASRYQNLTFEQLKIYYHETPLKLNEQFAHNLELFTSDGQYNYAAYLLSDTNGCSIKVAKYAGTTRVDLLENEEYGYCCLIKATKAVLEKLKIENKTFAKITDVKRLERNMIDPVALREAIINAIIHNDFSNEVPPKFELFSDRLEITSVGIIPAGFSQEDFFKGYSVPQNKELMRIFRDLDLVEQLGSGIPRILQVYPSSIYHFSPSFIRITFPFAEGFLATAQANDPASTPQVESILKYCLEPKSRAEIQAYLGLKDREHFRKSILLPLLESGQLLMTLPDKPSSPKQRFYTAPDTD